MPTPVTDDVGGPKSSQISELRGTTKWHDPLKKVREGFDFSHLRIMLRFSPVCGIMFQFLYFGQSRRSCIQ